jgi:hypothetical protein
MKRFVIMVTLAMAVGVAVGTALPTTPEAHAPSAPDSGEPFLPAYLLMLQGKRPFPTDDVGCPPAKDLRTLLVPCDWD